MPRVKIGDIDLSYRDSGGEGTPVVLLHGFPFEAALWDPQFAELGRRFRLIAPDLRGYGRSSLPEAEGYSMAAFASDVAGLLDHLGVAQAVVGGLSMGGYVAFEFLRSYPGRVRALVLADTRPDADSPEVRNRREAQIRQISERGGASVVDGMIPALLSERTRASSHSVEAALRGVMEQHDRSWTGGLQAMLDRADSSAWLGDIGVPVLILVGDQDPITPPQVARAMNDRLPDSTLVVIEGAAHVSNLEDPVAFNAALEAFLDRL